MAGNVYRTPHGLCKRRYICGYSDSHGEAVRRDDGTRRSALMRRCGGTEPGDTLSLCVSAAVRGEVSG
jgi:hypothetical protein